MITTVSALWHMYIALLQVIARGLLERGSAGAIVNISSQASTRVIENHVVYCTSKAAVDQLTRCLAFELGPHQVWSFHFSIIVIWCNIPVHVEDTVAFSNFIWFLVKAYMQSLAWAVHQLSLAYSGLSVSSIYNTSWQDNTFTNRKADIVFTHGPLLSFFSPHGVKRSTDLHKI